MFNNTDFTTLEVKFTQADLLEESKKKAIEAYDENNKCLGLIFNSGLELYDKNSDLDEDCLPDIPEMNYLEPIKAIQSTYNECIKLIKKGEIDKGNGLATSIGIYDPEHPLISFLPSNAIKRKEKLGQSGNLLPWTSADSITIFPL
jgi:hypothetical protein